MFEFENLPIELRINIIEELDYIGFKKFKQLSKSCYKFIYSIFNTWLTSFKLKRKVISVFDINTKFYEKPLDIFINDIKVVKDILNHYGFLYSCNNYITIRNITKYQYIQQFSRIGIFHILLVTNDNGEDKYNILCIVEPQTLYF